MVGTTYKSEKSTFRDEITGRSITRLTGAYSNYHLYFTDNSYTLGNENEIYFYSNRPDAQSKIYNFFKMDLQSGVITQVTDEPAGVSAATKTPDSEYIVYTTGPYLKKLHTPTGKTEVLYETPQGWKLKSFFISHDKKYCGFILNEKTNVNRDLPNYGGFKEQMFSIKRSKIMLAYMDGSHVLTVLRDTHNLGHFQFSPDDSNIALFCHEGPWNYVQQRMWVLDILSGEVTPILRQEEDDSVGHEFWTQDGLIFFDNRRRGHDGTITSDRTQAVTDISKVKMDGDQMPYVGLADRQGNILKTYKMPFYCNHYHATPDNTVLIGDEVDNIVRIDLKKPDYKPEILCCHGTSWHTQMTHCHPTVSWSVQRLLYTSDKGGLCNLYEMALEP